ncbi:LacI family DNA-binding transcriptional regulator [Paenibacillus sp. HJGM_3]|uniref:LacI family DNA-binding transcriptional regulator n=1 Tax=Paenibacillus sp. HJGM_3 TaxID=3379816 RepID=UPI00385C9FB7
MPIRKPVTQRTIAKQLGVTVQTVSKAFKGKPGMAESTRQLIMQTAEKLGYFTNEQIRSLKAETISPYPNERKRFLLVQTEESLSYNRKLLEGLHERFASFGHQVELHRLPKSTREADMAEYIEQHGLAYADGIFIAPSIVPKAWEQALFRLEIPTVLLNFPPPGVRVDSVIWDIYDATYQAVAYLRSLGHRRLMYVGDTYEQRGFILRWQAFQQALREFGELVDPSAHSIGARTDESWIDDVKSKLVRFTPTALVCGVHQEVRAVYRLCEAIGLRVPEQLSIVGLLNEQPDGLPLFTRPLLSIRETGYRAADRMLWRLANPTLPHEHTRIQGEFLVGATTAPYRESV